MYRLSLIISEIYNKYLPLAEKDGIVLNLDFSDTTKEVTDPERIKQFLDEHLESTLKRSDKGEVTIGVDKEAITITDSATTLSRAACALLSNHYIDVTSHVGFGTTVKIFFKPRELNSDASSTEPPKKLSVEGVSVDISVDSNPKQPAAQTEAKNTAAKGKHKGKLQTARTKRQLASAAKKADKEVKRIAKKANKQKQKLAKTARKATKTTTSKSQKIQNRKTK